MCLCVVLFACLLSVFLGGAESLVGEKSHENVKQRETGEWQSVSTQASKQSYCLACLLACFACCSGSLLV